MVKLTPTLLISLVVVPSKTLHSLYPEHFGFSSHLKNPKASNKNPKIEEPKSITELNAPKIAFMGPNASPINPLINPPICPIIPPITF